MQAIIRVVQLNKTYDPGFRALRDIDLDIYQGEIIALLGPNGAGKTTLIGIICGLITPSSGAVTVAGYDIVRDYRAARALIGLVPQELALETPETVGDTLALSRGIFGKGPDPAYIDSVLKALGLADRKDARVMTLSGGMKRRVMIGKALAHQPRVLFLDEPTAGVDVELRKDMWNTVRELKASGVTIILTTHYIEEAEEMADRIGILHKGELILVEDKDALLAQLGEKRLKLRLRDPLQAVPDALRSFHLALEDEGSTLTYTCDGRPDGDPDIAPLLDALVAAHVRVRDIDSRQNSLEEIFVSLVKP